MSELHDILWSVCRKLPSDFQPYGERDRAMSTSSADCSSGCIHFVPLVGEAGKDWGVCANPESPRAGLLTFEHQGCPEFTAADEDEAEAPVERKADGLAHGTGPLRKMKIVEYEMTDALEQTESIEGQVIRSYLDSETGQILQLFPEWDDCEELSKRIDEGMGRYHKIDALDSHESFAIMENFAESLPASSWKSRLVDALSRNKPFRRFKDVLHSDPKLLDEWFVFRQEALREYARDWLNSLGIEPEFVRTAGSA